MTQPTVFVAMSGGVDSSVAAYLLKEAGHSVAGLHMDLWCEEKQGKAAQTRTCCSLDDARDAETVCKALHIPFYVLNLRDEFQKHVVEPFCREYGIGRTPNPCLSCNEHIKFGLLLQKCLALGGEYLATGHYARIREDAGRYHLLKGSDPSKDQSYFLYMLGQQELRHVLFPVGNMTKTQVRRMAEDAGLPVAEKRESMDICFVPDGDYRPFVAARMPQSPGDIVDAAGKVVGRHDGLAGYTIGQRSGISSGGGRRTYVVDIDAHNNRLIIGDERELYSSALVARDVHWVSGEPPASNILVAARIRYRAAAIVAALWTERDYVRVSFAEPQRAITPGQAVVFYAGEDVLGGAIIDRVERHAQMPSANDAGRATAAGERL